jgi:hypothetical protein
MLRRCIALTVLVLAGTALVQPEASAGSFGFASGLPGGARVGGFRAPFAAHRAVRVGPARQLPGASGTIPQRPFAGATRRVPGAYGLRRPFAGPATHPATRSVAHGFGRNLAPDLHARFVRRHHRGSIAGYVYPFTSEGYDAPYHLGTPYDPAEAIPVYAPPSVYSVPAEDEDAAPPSRQLVPRQTGLRDENREACRSERVTVPASSGDGEREINVVRC